MIYHNRVSLQQVDALWTKLKGYSIDHDRMNRWIFDSFPQNAEWYEAEIEEIDLPNIFTIPTSDLRGYPKYRFQALTRYLKAG